MNVGFVRATVVDNNTFRPIYSGRILYSCKEDFPSHDADGLSDSLSKRQNTIDFVALDSNGDLTAGEAFGRHALGTMAEPLLVFEVDDYIDKNHSEYQECIQDMKSLAESTKIKPGKLVEEPSDRVPDVLDWDYIDANLVWVAHFESGYRVTGTHDEVKGYYSADDIDEIDTVTWRGQPKDLQGFCKAYTYGFYDLGRHDLYKLKDFYDEWSKDPSKFVPKQKPVIGKLSDVLSDLDPSSDLIVSNYYGYEGAGNHRVGNFIEALNDMGIDFNIIQFDPSKDGSTAHVYVQTDNLDALEDFSVEANKNAINHDPYFGDGKYEKVSHSKGLAILNKAVDDIETTGKNKPSFCYVNGISDKLVKPHSKNDKLSVVRLPIDGEYGSLVLFNNQVLDNKYRKDCKNLKLDSDKEYKIYKNSGVLSMAGNDIKSIFEKSREEYKLKMAEYDTEIESDEPEDTVDLEV